MPGRTTRISPWRQPLDFGWGDKGTTGEMNQFCIDRHNGTMNFAFADWSARQVGLKELWTLRWHRNFNVNNSWTKAGRCQPAIGPVAPSYKDY